MRLALRPSRLELIADFVTEILVLGLYPGLQNIQAFQGVFQVPDLNISLETCCQDQNFRQTFRQIPKSE